jgi:transglutaminase-like putative cysteine protease
MIAALRARGLAACYASGYILTMPPPGQPRLLGADASHAWVSVFLPGSGWIDVDPTNNLVCGDQHVAVAYGRDFSDVSMLSGAVTGGGEHTIAVEVTMQPT